MGKIMDFFTKNKNYVIAVIVLLLLIGIFVGGIMIGKGNKTNQDLKQTEKQLTTDIKKDKQEVTTSKKEASSLIDSAAIYLEFAKRKANDATTINNTINNTNNESKKNISHIDSLSNDSNVILFSKLAQEYINSTTN